MKDCCEKAVNSDKVSVERVNESLIFIRCPVCNCRHFELTVDPGQLGLKGADL
jgi:hypothetical protein